MTIESDYPVVWERYAPVYDLMSRNNPSYVENIQSLITELRARQLPPNARVIDVGAGTGNFLESIQPLLSPEAELVHLDFNKAMNDVAIGKYREKSFDNIQVVTEYVQRVDFPTNHFDVIICVHALYAMHPQRLVLEKMKDWLRPNGLLFIIDLGRTQNWSDWAWYIYKSMVRRMGFWKATYEARKFFEVARQNYLLRRGQSDGTYSTRTTEEFQEFLASVGLEIVRIGSCYRGYSDVAICSKYECLKARFERAS